MSEIAVPKPESSDYGKAQTATEIAFRSLIETASKLGLKLDPVMGLMYLPSQEITRQFQEACRAVLTCLGANVKAEDA